jgi:hypothetical protein
MTMKLLRAVLPCWVSLVMCLLAVPVQGAIPSTAADQARWLADLVASGLQQQYGSEVAPETVAAGQAELIEGLPRILPRPLTPWELVQFQAVLCDDGGPVSASDVAPVEMGLRRSIRLRIAWLQDYLPRPALTDDDRGLIDRQLGELAELLRAGLVADLSPGFADEEAANAIIACDVTNLFSRPAGRLIASAVGPYFKRPFSPEEMRSLEQLVTRVVADARARWERAKERAASLSPGASLEVADLVVATGAPIASFTRAAAAMQWPEPVVLSPAEQDLWRRQLEARRGENGGTTP